jgi:hypothetical protein
VRNVLAFPVNGRAIFAQTRARTLVDCASLVKLGVARRQGIPSLVEVPANQAKASAQFEFRIFCQHMGFESQFDFSAALNDTYL